MPADLEDVTPDLAISVEKIRDYLLNVNHAEGGAKAKFFISRGFSPDAQEIFVKALMRHGRPSNLLKETATKYGVKRVYEGKLDTPDGTNPRVRSVWHKATDDFLRLLVTAYPI